MTTTVSAVSARAWVAVDLAALVANARVIAACAGRPLLPMVKANGYGLGAVAVARALEAVDPWGFGVATPEEGAALREAGIRRPIVVFTPLQAGSIPLLLQHDLRPSVGDPGALGAWLTLAPGRPFHVEIDTGMGRAGIRWSDAGALAACASLLHDAEGWEGVFMHFHSADTDIPSATEQWDRFTAALGVLPRRPPLVHAGNSAAALRLPDYAADLVRPGIFLYGCEVCDDAAAPAPVARLHARVVATRRIAAGETVGYGATWHAARPTTIATLGIGYADGVPRALSNAGAVELRGCVVPIVGRVTMDMTMVDAGDLPVEPGDVVTVWGGAVTLAEQARRAGTISYELLTALGPRVERRYEGGS